MTFKVEYTCYSLFFTPRKQSHKNLLDREYTTLKNIEFKHERWNLMPSTELQKSIRLSYGLGWQRETRKIYYVTPFSSSAQTLRSSCTRSPSADITKIFPWFFHYKSSSSLSFSLFVAAQVISQEDRDRNSFFLHFLCLRSFRMLQNRKIARRSPLPIVCVKIFLIPMA